jgi:N-acetylglucosamine PTS system EIICBA or EIICB component
MFATLQKLGRSLMLPIAVMPVAALLLRFGQPDVLNIPFLANAGGAIFDNLALLFAIGVAVGFTADAGTAGIAAAVGFWVFRSVLLDISKLIYGQERLVAAFGENLRGADMGVLSGILAGLLAAFLYERYHTIKLPEWLAFFGGKRFVPIVTAGAALVLGALFGAIWIWPGQGLNALANWTIGAGPLGAAIHAFLNRLLIPFGLHHVLNTVVWFQFGDLTNFLSSQGAEGGLFMTGFFPIMMFGLPAAALAMYTTAKDENKKAIGGVLFGAALTSLLTGITEPIEFAFMFVAPVLYLVHAALTAVSAYVTIALGMRDGFGFSAGLVDFVINWNIATNPVGLLVVGLAFGVIYYFVFVALIKAMDIPTPGREPEPVAE